MESKLKALTAVEASLKDELARTKASLAAAEAQAAERAARITALEAELEALKKMVRGGGAGGVLHFRGCIAVVDGGKRGPANADLPVGSRPSKLRAAQCVQTCPVPVLQGSACPAAIGHKCEP